MCVWRVYELESIDKRGFLWNWRELSFQSKSKKFIVTKDDEITIYTSTMLNMYFCYFANDGIGMGSDEFFGLYVEKNLTKGASHNCKTYSNETLSEKKHFKIRDIEVWGFNQ